MECTSHPLPIKTIPQLLRFACALHSFKILKCRSRYKDDGTFQYTFMLRDMILGEKVIVDVYLEVASGKVLIGYRGSVRSSLYASFLNEFKSLLVSNNYTSVALLT